MKPHPDWLIPDWPAPESVASVVTTRAGGCSQPPFDAMNLGLHVGDDPAVVAGNRQQLRDQLHLDLEPQWLNQVHGITVVEARDDGQEREADACFSRVPGQACAVMTADCLPVLFCAFDGSVVGAAHAGWRGLVAGALEATVAAMGRRPPELMAWLGPAIGPNAFEVGAEVRAAFLHANPASEDAFLPGQRQAHWLADLYELARIRLRSIGIEQVFGGGLCTHSDARRFYSYRRDQRTGRMASLIWIKADPVRA